MCRLLRLGVAGATCAGVLALASVGAAQDGGADAAAEGGADAGGDGGPPTMTPGAILAYYCGDAEMQCMTAPLEYEYTHDLAPWLPDIDTGWIPQNFDELQVRFVLQIPADTMVRMAGRFKATWPQPLTIATPGERTTGFLKIDYGLVVQALGKIDIEILGVGINWQGPIPYVPQVDFHLLGMEQFDPWAFQPNPVSVSAYSPTVRLFKVNVLGLAGIPDEIAEGGVELDLKGELQATYYTERMLVEPSVAPITTENGETLHNFLGGPYVELDVHPEGHIKYDGIIHLIPAFYIEVLGQDFQIPFYDWELNLTDLLDLDLASQIVFDTVRVHVPLPDIPKFEDPAVVDFGDVEVGSGKKLALTIPNDGEATARAVGEVEAGMTSTFKMLSASAMIEPGESEEMEMRFLPKEQGKFEATLTIRSNDPDLPEQTVLLRGNAKHPDDPVYPGEDSGTNPNPPEDGGTDLPGSSYDAAGDDGGCGCRTSAGGSSAPIWLGLLGLAGAGLVRRRNRSAREQKGSRRRDL